MMGKVFCDNLCPTGSTVSIEVSIALMPERAQWGQDYVQDTKIHFSTYHGTKSTLVQYALDTVTTTWTLGKH